MTYIPFNHLRKACPEGQHYHYGGMTCHDINKPHKAGTKANEWHQKHGLVTSEGGKDTDTEKPKKEKTEQSSDVPKPREYRKIEKYNDDAHDIPTDEAEWIFNQGSDGKALQTKIDEQKGKVKNGKDKYESIKDKEDVTVQELFDCIASETGMTAEHIEDDKVGKTIGWSSDAKYDSVKNLSREATESIVETVFDTFDKLYIPHPIQYGVQINSGAYGCCWSNSDGSSRIRYTTSDFNFLNDTNDETARRKEDVRTTRVKYAKKTVVHEMVHSNINAVAHDGIMKGMKNEEISGDLASYCGTITHGDTPKRWNGDEAFTDSSCSKNYVYFGKFTQQVLKDAKKVAEELYGMDNHTFMRQMTAYGRTRPKEGIPEAIAEYLIEGDDASLANKLIYFAFMRYVRFVYDDEQKDIEPIYKSVRNLREKQGKKRTKKKSIHKQRYISFEEILKGVI